MDAPGTAVDDDLMGLALAEAERCLEHGDVPVGAVVVRNGAVVGAGRNARERLQDPTAHAEILALREAAQAAGSWRILDATLYVTLEPCAMCAGAIVLARVPRVVYGATDAKAGAAGSVLDVLAEPRLNHRPSVIGGVRADRGGCPAAGVLRGPPLAPAVTLSLRATATAPPLPRTLPRSVAVKLPLLRVLLPVRFSFSVSAAVSPPPMEPAIVPTRLGRFFPMVATRLTLQVSPAARAQLAWSWPRPLATVTERGSWRLDADGFSAATAAAAGAARAARRRVGAGADAGLGEELGVGQGRERVVRAGDRVAVPGEHPEARAGIGLGDEVLGALRVAGGLAAHDDPDEVAGLDALVPWREGGHGVRVGARAADRKVELLRGRDHPLRGAGPAQVLDVEGGLGVLGHVALFGAALDVRREHLPAGRDRRARGPAQLHEGRVLGVLDRRRGRAGEVAADRVDSGVGGCNRSQKRSSKGDRNRRP